MSDATIPGGQAPSEDQNLEAAKPVESSEPQVAEAATPVESVPDANQSEEPAQSDEPADQVNDDTPGVDDVEEPTS